MSNAASPGPQPAPQLDFLARVIDSAFGRAIPLEPRLPSLFEPQTLQGSAEVAWSTEVSRPDRESAASAPGEVELEREPRTPRPAARDRPVSSERAQAIPKPPSEPLRRPAADSAWAKAEPGSRVPARADARRHSHVEEKAAASAALLADVPRGALMPETLVATAPRMQQPRSMRAPEGREPPRSAELGEDAREQRLAPALPMRTIRVEPASMRLRSAADALYAQVTAPSPEPVINVTIGRIEVRALPVQPTSSRARVEGPKPTSLGDYLKQRGARR